MNIRLHCNGKVTQNSTWLDIEESFKELEKKAFFRLSIMPEPQAGPMLLEVQSEDGNYLPGMLIAGEGNRDYLNYNNRDKAPVSIGGYDYDPITVTQDFDLIVRMVKEFFETGDVSEELFKVGER